MTKFEKIEELEKRKMEIWDSKMALHGKIMKLNKEYQKCEEEIGRIRSIE